MKRRVALILPSSTYRARDFLEAARAVDAELVIATEKSQVLTDPSRLVHIDLDRPQWSADQVVANGPFDAVIPVDDRGVLIGALAAESLHLPHSPAAAVAATRNKAAMRALFAGAGVPQPRFVVLGSGDDAVAAVTEIGVPAVMKPVSLAASQGVIRIDDGGSATTTAERIRGIVSSMGNHDTDLLVEEFMPGPEVALEAMMANGELVPLAFLDKPDPLDGPYFEETMFVTPSRHSGAVQSAVIETVGKAAAALGLVEGPVHAELRVDGEGARMLEIAARPIGGLCSRALEFGVFGSSLEDVLVRNALRLPQAGLDQAVPASGVLMIPIPRPGRLLEVTNMDEAKSVVGITEIEITMAPGHRLQPLPEGNRYLGFIFARALTPVAVEEALRHAHRILDIRITED